MKLKNGQTAELGQLVTGPDAHGNQVTGVIVSIDEKSKTNNLGIVLPQPGAYITAAESQPAKKAAKD